MKNVIKTDLFEIVNNTPEMAIIYPVKHNEDYTGFDSNYLVLDFGEKKKGDLIEMNMLFKSETLKVRSASSSCGCTDPTVQKIDDKTWLIVVKYDTNKVANKISKGVSINLSNNKSLKLNLIINK